MFIISSPSGVGKSTLIQEILKIQPFLKVSTSYTTRDPRPIEKNGKHYYFISKRKFKTMIQKNVFLEYTKIFGNYYGTSKYNIKNIMSQGMDIILDIDWKGYIQIKKKITKSCSIFIFPPSKKELYQRLKKRKQDTQKSILKRIGNSIPEMKNYKKYNYLIFNDNFNKALLDLKTIICAEHLRTKYQKVQNYSLLKKLLLG